MSRFKKIKLKFSLFLAVMGPGIVTAFADNDAGGIATYAAAGAKFGYSLLFIMFLSTVCLVIAQEISARTGAVTGRGLADLIREQYGVKWTLFAMLVLLVANIGTTASEFSGIATSFEIFGVSKYISVPIIALLIWWLVIKTNYNRIEKIFFLLCGTFLSYVLSGFFVKPDWQQVWQASITPVFVADVDFLTIAIGVVGTTITPWGQFYVQASVVDKGITAKDYRYTQWDVYIGSFFTGFIAFFIIVATAATLFTNNISIETAKDAAIALEPVAGKYATLLFAFGLLGASMLAAFILPLSTAYAVCEAFGFEHGISKSYEQAPVFFGLYTALIIVGAGLVMWPDLSLYKIMLTSQIVNGMLLPPILIFMVLIAGNKELMGHYCNSKAYNAGAWLFTLVLIVLSVMLVLAAVLPDVYANIVKIFS